MTAIPRNLKWTVVTRDNYICRLCGAFRRRLHVHHVGYGEYNNPDTCISLCAKCHQGVGGYGNTAIKLSPDYIRKYNRIIDETKKQYPDLIYQYIPLPPSDSQLIKEGKAIREKNGAITIIIN